MNKLLIITISLLILFFSACSNQNEPEKKVQIPKVQIQVLNFTKNNNFKKVIGTIKPINEILIKAELSGRINKLNFKVGDKIEKEDILAELGDSQGMDALMIQYLDALKSYQNVQNLNSNTENLYDNTISSTNDSLTNSFSILSKTKTSSQLQIDLLEEQVSDAKKVLENAKNNLETAKKTNELELSQTENSQEQLKMNLDFAEKNLENTELSLKKAEQDLEKNTSTLFNTVYSAMTKTEVEMDKIRGYTNSTSNDAYDEAFGVSNSNLKTNVFLEFQFFDSEMKEFKKIYKDYEIEKYTLDEMFDYFEQYLSSERDYLDKYYVLATDYTTAVGNVQQITVDSLVSNIYGLVIGLATQQNSLNQLQQAFEQLKLDSDIALLASQNQYNQAETAYENSSDSVNLLQQKHDNQISSLEFALDIAKNNLVKAETQLEKTKVDVDLQIKNLTNSIENLANTVSQQQANKSLQLTQLEGQSNKTNTQIDILESQLKRKFIKSPIDGIILQKYTEPGNLVNPGEPLFSVGDLDEVKIIASVNQDILSELKVNEEANIYCDKCEVKNYKAQIINISDSLDQITKQGVIELKLQNINKELKSNMIVDIDFTVDEEDKIFIPMKNIKISNSEYSVFVYENGLAIEKTIEIGNIFGDMVEIISGLNQGDILIISNTQDLKDGDKVEREKVRVK
ncbi:hypothetical protein A2335_04735 [Candidatus Peregrinibacteria bacterium RIFOXYB2_FULL_32_7]|nr:MAG: hypothetical protein A2335_04735 [Candidatus Peregrinibacteria bacterium RIFOXYB2_FULL_32_7]